MITTTARGALSRIPVRAAYALLGLLLLALAPGLSAQEPGQADCDETDAGVLCGPRSAEDLVWLPGTGRFIASRMTTAEPPGGLYLVDPGTRTFTTLYPTARSRDALDETLFPGCPGAPDTGNFSTHGLALQTLDRQRHRLYVTAHGARESVEVFDIDTARGVG